jgi:hypothetical protein
MAKYIRCDCCGKPVRFGEDVYQYEGYCGLYCSSECFADSYANCLELDEDIAENCRHEVYDDEKRVKELRQNIASMEKALWQMKAELDSLD